MRSNITGIFFLPVSLKGAKPWRNTGDKRIHDKAVKIVMSILRDPSKGLGNPKVVKELKGGWCREIDKDHLIMYWVDKNHLTLLDFREEET